MGENMFNWQGKVQYSNDIPNSNANEIKGISTEEILSLKNRIKFYLEHYSIIGKKLPARDILTKVDKLKIVLELVDAEIQRRSTCINL